MQMPQMRRMRDATWRIVVERAERTRPDIPFKMLVSLSRSQHIVEGGMGRHVVRGGKEREQTQSRVHYVKDSECLCPFRKLAYAAGDMFEAD